MRPLAQITIALALAAPAAAQPNAAARAVVDSAVARMGGRAALEGVRTVQYEILTQWLALAPDATPFRDGPSYERQTEWRDYGRKVWRNVRRFPTAAGWQEITDLVLDTVPARRFPSGGGASIANPAAAVNGWAPLNVAYVDERRELWLWAPERLALGLAAAPDLRARPDTTIGGAPHAVVTATVDGVPVTAFVRRATMLPAAVRYRADESNDFGLAPWGPMEVEVWYSRWAPNGAGAARVVAPRQWDTRRVGRPYKRMSVVSAAYNAPMADDSLVIADTVRALYAARGRRPMGDVPIDSAAVAAGGAALGFYGIGAPAAAVRVGDTWHLVDGGNLPVNAERAAAWIAANTPGGASRTGPAIVTTNRPSSVAVWAARAGRPTLVAPAGLDPVRSSVARWGAPTAQLQPVTTGRWLRGGADSVWVEPVDLPNGAGLLVYVPSQRWAYSGAVATPVDAELVAAAIRRRGWAVERVGVPGRVAGIVVPN